MSSLFDDISRIIARPMPRRQAFKLVGGAVGGAALASLGLGRVSRAFGAPAGGPQPLVTCKPGTIPCGTGCCPSSQTCCANVCCAAGQNCSPCSGGPSKCCNPGTICCPGPKAGKFQCCVPGSGGSASGTCVGATRCV